MFSQLTQERIKYYVYCLRDPDTNETFYIGKGIGNRVFSHANGELEKDKNYEKIDIIKSIRKKGKQVDHWIIRHGLSEKEAFEVEAALIDFIGLDNLSNNVKGHNTDRGKISCEELNLRLGAEKIVIEDNIMIIKINSQFRIDMKQEEIYEATRRSWVASKKRAEKADYVLSTCNGIVREVFKPTEWFKEEDSNRIGFFGEVAQKRIREKYLHKSIEEYVTRGNANPIQYISNNGNIVIDSSEIKEQEEIEDEVVITEKAILIKINSSYREGMTSDEIYNATRGIWKLNIEKARKAEYVFGIANGIVIEVYKVDNWNLIDNTDRIAFEGVIAIERIRNKYLGKSVKHLYSKGEANPCKYQNIDIECKKKMNYEWDGVTKSKTTNDERDSKLNNLFQLVEECDWNKIIREIKKSPELINSIKPDGINGFTLLHYAAVNNINVNFVKQLLKYGAWKTIRSFDGDTAFDIAERLSNTAVVSILKPEYKIIIPHKEVRILEKYFHELIYEITEGLVIENSLRLPQLEVLLELGEVCMWFPVPGMYGGFNFYFTNMNGDFKLVSESWSRIVGESEQKHEISLNGILLVDEGTYRD